MLIAPSKARAVKPAARGELPLGFCRELFPYPARVGFGILVGKVDDRVLFKTLE